MEIYNPGDFPEGYTPEDFIKGEEHFIPRSPLIASVLFRTKDVEEWGSGLKRISKACAEYGVKVTFRVLKSGFLVTFHRKSAKSFLPSTVEKTVEKTREKIIALIRHDPKIRRQRLRTRGRVRFPICFEVRAAFQKMRQNVPRSGLQIEPPAVDELHRRPRRPAAGPSGGWTTPLLSVGYARWGYFILN